MTDALWVFVSVIAMFVVGLAVDRGLEWLGWRTITQWVQILPWLGVMILVVYLVGACALAIHFWGSE